MSKLAIQGNASGTGTFTIAAPNSNTDRTLTLPDEAGTVLTSGGAIDVNASAPADSLAINASGNVGIGDSNPTATTGTARFLKIGDSSTSNCGLILEDETNEWELQCNDSLTVFVNDTYKARFNTGTGLLIGTTNNSPAESSSTNGNRLGYAGGGQFSKAGSEVIRINRNTNDGRIIGLCGQAVVRGEIAVSGTTIQYTSFSDHRLKENVTAISDGIGLVKTLNPVNFDWIETSQNVNGFLAHEVQTVVPEAVTGSHNEVDDEGNPVYQGIDQSKLVPILTAALQEAIAKIETLETTVADLQTRVTALEATP